MSIPSKRQSTSHQQDKSDVLSLLLSIESMYQTCQTVLNTYTQTTLMLSITIEAQMLLMKLQVMKDRWLHHLPFKEACKVDFYDWSKKVEKMGNSLWTPDEEADNGETMPEYCPSKHFMLDLYEKLQEEQSTDREASCYFRELNIPKFVAAQDKMRKQISKHWKRYQYEFSDMIARQIDGRIGNVLQPLAGKSVVIRMTCCEVLNQLSQTLYQLYEMPAGVIQRDQFARLAERVISEPEYGGKKAQTNARRDLENLKNTTPEEEWEERCEDEINASIDMINEMKYGCKSSHYLGRSYDIKGHYSGLGRFLNSVRRDISEEELAYLLEQLFRLLYFREDLEQLRIAAMPIEAEEPSSLSAPTPSTSPKDSRAVYQKRKNTKAEMPKLPFYFHERLAENDEARQAFYKTLHHCGFYIGRTLLEEEKRNSEINCYNGWKWCHLREAFMNMGVIRKDTPKKSFAEYLEAVFPFLDADNVKRGFNSRGTIPDQAAFNRIVGEMQNEFKPVIDIINGVSDHT
ncbi:MAG: hypothetical protein IKP43_03650 [Bacteroidaceae bacterium]|nr:hypothetical protein [Bacteroidaceae bacterium]